MDIAIEPRMVHEDLQTAANKKCEKQEVDIMSDTQLGRIAIGRRDRFGDIRRSNR